MGNLSALNNDRVVVVHGVWGAPGGKVKLSWLATGIPTDTPAEAIHKKHGRVRTFKAEKLQETAYAISNRHRDLFKFWMDHFIRPAAKRSLKRTKPTS
jgi:hypothetical protein